MMTDTLARPLGYAHFRVNTHVVGRRVAAAFWDGLILFVLQALLSPIYGVAMVGVSLPPPFGWLAYFGNDATLTLPLVVVLTVVYYTVQEALLGTTIGKRFMSLRVVGVDGQRIGWRAALLRNVIRPIDNLPTNCYGVGAVTMLLSPRRQRLGDRVAKTLVVDADPTTREQRTPREARRTMAALLTSLALIAVFSTGFAYYGRPALQLESWKNARLYVFDRPVYAYTLGPARWGPGTVTYPIEYRTPEDSTPCHGSVTLRWAGFFGGGWRAGPASILCQRYTYGYAGL